jgi:hypothetical protein
MGAGFVMVPAWLRRKKPSGNAYAVYVNLAAFGTWNPEAGSYDECRPAVATLAEQTGLSTATVKRALAELYGLGAVERTVVIDPLDGQRPSVYRVMFGSVVEPGSRVSGPSSSAGSQVSDPRITDDPPQLNPRVTDDLGGGSRVSHYSEPLTKTEIKGRRTGASTTTSGEQSITPVWSGTTTPLEDFGRAIDERTDELMDGWKRWMGKPVPRQEVADLRNALRSLVAEGIERDDLVAGMKLWTSKGYTPAWLAKCVRQCQAPADAAPPRRNPARERQGSLVESVQAVAARLSGTAGDPPGSLSRPWRAAIGGV